MEFIENPFEPKNEVLKDLKDKIEKKGLSFHPYLAMQAINKEVEVQATDLVVSHFKGMGIDALGKCNQEIKEFAEVEEARWQAYQEWKKENEGASVTDISNVKKLKKK